ncbi:MAG: TSUP family transporter, partial [Bryobacteraceae bacterium]
MPELTLLQWILGTCSAYMVGVAKTGVPGLGILVVPMMVLAVGDAKQSAGWLLPILCLADVFAVIYWRRHAAASKLFSLLPWVVCGMIAGSFALTLHERVLRNIVGAIIFAMLSVYLYRRRYTAGAEVPSHAPTYGITAGFATTVANAAGPVMNLYLLSKRLPKEEFIATGA